MTRHRAMLLVVAALLSVAGGWKAFLAPGPVAAGHEEIAGNCDACHLAFDGVPDERCLDCHDAIAARQASGTGWHAANQDKRCVACHTDHKGADARLVKADVAFQHDQGALAGAHARLKCGDCHTGPLQAEPTGCLGCHGDDDPHESAHGPQCESCHTAVGWKAGLFTLEEHDTPMDGGHAGLACADCHVQGQHTTSPVACNACHDKGHGGTVTPCEECHEVSGFKPAKFDHGPCTCAFPGKHQTVECVACHVDFDFTDTPTLCGSCHDADRTHQPLGECAACHTATSWKQGRFDHNRQSSFHLDGAHLAVSCTQCHTEQGVFRGEPTTCEGCHATEAHPDFGGCAECHTTAGFAPSRFDHAGTGFPLVGKHAGAPCSACHSPR